MADISDIMKDVKSDDVYYEEKEKESSIKSGTYEATIVDLTRKLNIKTKAGHICDIYWPRYKISSDSPKFSNRLIRDSGQFRYRSEEVRKRNLYYKKYLDKAEISLTKSEVDGNIRYSLPSISKDMILGKHVLINVYVEEWNDSRGYHKEPVAKLVKIIKDSDVIH
tara:strand:+ start:738 stop:1235 length:498 start_codon:yes stop_codon:yes gene_type:complete